jgi:DNA-binding SARP family transcriptional activator
MGNLRSAVWRLRRASERLLEVGRETLEIAPGVSVDVREVADVAECLEYQTRGQLPRVELFTSDLLPGWYDEWVLVEREKHRQRCLHALDRLAASLAKRQQYGAALQAALTAIAHDPFRETSHRQVISFHLREGNHSEAHRHYLEYQRLIEAELGIRPSPLLQNLMRATRAATAS